VALPTTLIRMGAPAQSTLAVRQGDSVEWTVTVKDGAGAAIDLGSPCTATSKIKDSYTGSTLATMTCSVTAASGLIVCSLTPAQTAALTGSFSGRGSGTIGVWDVQVSDGTNIVTIARGEVVLYLEVTTP